MKNLTGKVAVITGAGSGIGRALAKAFAAEGCHLALVDINDSGLQETQTQINQQIATPITITRHTCNVADADAVKTLAQEIHQQQGAIHLLFNNAGITINKSFEDSSLQDLERVFGVNLWGVLYGCYYFLPYLKQQSEAHIINTSSLAGFMGMPNQAGYCASKAAVKSLSETLFAELAVHNIHVTSIHPGTISTSILRTAADSSGKNANTTHKMANLMERYGKSPDKLAQKVVKAVKKNRMQVRIGIDSYLGDVFKRLLPQVIHLPFRWGFKKAM